VDSSLRRFELIANPALRQHTRLQLQGRPLAWPENPEQPLAVRFRQEALFPCLHPCLPTHIPLRLELLEQDGGRRLGLWQLLNESAGFEPLTQADGEEPTATAAGPALRGLGEHCCTVDLRL